MDRNQLVKHYQAQTEMIFESFGPAYGETYKSFNGNSPVLFNTYGDPMTKHSTGVGTANELPMWNTEGGLFADCCLDSPVISLLSRPTQSLASLVPVMPNNNQLIKNAYVTGDFDVDGVFPDGVCEPGPNAGSFSSIYAEFRGGRTSFSTRTGELDALIENACRGVDMNRFYFVNQMRGVSGPPPVVFTPEMQNEIFTSAVYREMFLIANRSKQEWLKQFWYGDPTDATANGGYVPFQGLDSMITDQYGVATPWVTGAGDKTQLNSYVADFGSTCAGGANADGQTLYQVLGDMEFELANRDRKLGVQVDRALVVSSLLWKAIVESVACDMINDTCVSGTQLVDTSNIVVNANTDAIAAMKQQMRSTMRLAINGKSYPVLIDDFITVAENLPVDGGAEYESSLYFIPLRVNGAPSMEFFHKDYRQFNTALAGIPTELQSDIRGYTDRGIYHATIQRDLRCFIVDVKFEVGLKFMWPNLAGRIDNIKACFIGQHVVPAPAA